MWFERILERMNLIAAKNELIEELSHGGYGQVYLICELL